MNLEILENQSFWFSFEPGNTGKPVRMTHNNIILYGNPVRMIQNWPRILYGQYGPAGGRVGWLKHLRKNPFWEYVSWKTRIYNISLKAYFLIWFQKRRAPKNEEIEMALNGAWNRRGLDYLIDFGQFSSNLIQNKVI